VLRVFGVDPALEVRTATIFKAMSDDNGSSKHICNIGQFIQSYTTQQP
jgi:hypothetical protein